jgi:exopolysaccharide production protein ExoQ
MSDPESSPPLPIRWLRVLLLALWLAGGIGMTSLKWDWSVDFMEQADRDYQFKENTLEKQRAGLNSWLIIGYSSLAFLGIASVAIRGSVALPRFSMWHIVPLGLLLWCGSSFLWSVEPALTVRRIGHLYMAVLGGLGLVALLNRREILWAVTISLSSLCFIGVVAELSLGMFQPWRSGYRFCGIGHPNETGLFAICAILGGRLLWLLESQIKPKAVFNLRNLAILLVMLDFAIIILTRSRTTLFSGIIALLVIQYLYAQSVNAWLFFFGSSTIAVSVGLFLAIVPTSIYNLFFGVATVGRTTHLASLTGRIPLWEEIIRHWQREPMLGYGYGGYWTTKRVEDFAQMFYWEPPNGHSIYIDALVETGPVGLLLLIASLIALWLASVVEFAKSKQLSLLFVIGITTMMAIHGVAESTFFKGCFGPLMFALSICLLTAKPYRVPLAASQKSRAQSSPVAYS